MAVLGLCCYESCSLAVVASLVAEHGLQGMWASVSAAHGLSSCGSRAPGHRLNSCSMRALLLPSMWDLPGPGIEPVSPALAGGFLTAEPQEKPCRWILNHWTTMEAQFLINYISKFLMDSDGIKKLIPPV